MGKDTRLVNIYIKIHNKRTLTVEDLKYLSKYDPECFEKTCNNIVYKIPEAKNVLQPEADQNHKDFVPLHMVPLMEKPKPDQQKIEAVLANLGKMEKDEFPVPEVDTETVKELLGSLYMEMLFPHNDREKFFSMEESENLSVFNKKV
ncbi:MAG: hypothetical protein HFI69_04030 [Lachnospiraceae bacterium]|jgi:hypothetical protein|nr:hypothetical protein [Lachnospiraceae bacterium]